MKDEYDFTDAAKITDTPMREAVKRPLNRYQRRRQDRDLRKLVTYLEKIKGGNKVKDLTPEEQLAVKMNFLEKIKAANAEFEKQGEMEQ